MRRRPFIIVSLVLAVSTAIGAVVARLLRGRLRVRTERRSAHQALQAVSSSETAGAAGGGTSAVGTGDDLKVIEGIGPRIEGVMKDAGVTTYTELADLTPARITRIMKEAGTRMAKPDTWPDQARMAAEGRWDELRAFQETLKAGRRRS